MICNDVAEYISALCDGKTIPPPAAQHIGTCPDCQARLSDYLAMGVELRRAASLGLAEAVASRAWTKSQNRVATWWQKGRRTIRIPRLAFAGLIAGILVLASALAVNRARAQNTGSVVVLTTVGPNGPLASCALSTQDKSQNSCVWHGQVGPRFLAYKVYLVTRDGGRVRLWIGTMTYTPGADPASPESQVGSNKFVWFEPGEPLKFDVPQVGTLTLEGEWMDHMPMLGTLEPIPNEIRLGMPLFLKDNVVVGDLSRNIAGGGIFSVDGLGLAFGFYISGEGRFLLSLLPMKGAVKASVVQGRISFEEGGHSWELLSGVPVCRADHIWVLHQPDFKSKAIGPYGACCSIPKLVQTEPGLWEPQEKPN
jgi:hypothetical protein